MRAMILAAGLGTRLSPLTDTTPKALIKIRDKTLLEITINHLVKNGFDKIIINVHHFAEQIVKFLDEKNFNADIAISDESDVLLDTGGGLKKASCFFNDEKPFLIHNVDVISNLDLSKLYKFHLNSAVIATLVIRKRESSRFLMFNSENILCGWRNLKSGETKVMRKDKLLHEFAFSGIHFVNPKIFSFMPEKDIFSLIDLYLNIANKRIVHGFIDEDSFWLDVGKPENLKIADDAYEKFVIG